MVSVCIGKHSAWHSLDGNVVLHLDGDSEMRDGALVPLGTFICERIQVGVPSKPFGDFPQLHCLVCKGIIKMASKVINTSQSATL